MGLAAGSDSSGASTMGMTLVRLLVEELGGSLNVRNEFGTHASIRNPFDAPMDGGSYFIEQD